MKVNIRITAWLSGCFCLILLTLGVFLWLSTPNSKPAELSTLVTTSTLSSSPNSTAQILADVTPQTAVDNLQTTSRSISPPLPPITYPLGSIGEACEVNTYPPRVGFFDLDREVMLSLENSPFDSTGENFKLLKSPKCLTALETYINPINPYLWGREHNTHGFHSAHAFVDIDNPLNFERIFTDPAGDFARVQEALARPECQLSTDDEPNLRLNETCHADAIHNYALIARFCYGVGIYTRPYQWYSKEDNPNPEQDRSMWIHSLENAWVTTKCDDLDPNIDLQLPIHTELRQQIQELDKDKTLNETLIELAARLGDEAAGLTHPVEYYGTYGRSEHSEEGYKYGPLTEWFVTDLTDPTNLFSKLAPSVDRLRQFVSLFEKNIKAKGKLIKFDHEALVRHLCAPPYYIPPSVDEDPTPEPPSCREIVNELRQETLSPAMSDAIITFEDVAIHLDAYE